MSFSDPLLQFARSIPSGELFGLSLGRDLQTFFENPDAPATWTCTQAAAKHIDNVPLLNKIISLAEKIFLTFALIFTFTAFSNPFVVIPLGLMFFGFLVRTGFEVAFLVRHFFPQPSTSTSPAQG